MSNDISLRMLLDTSGFAAGINSSVAMLGTFQRAQVAAFAPNGPKLNVAQFQAEVEGLNAANLTVQSSLKSTAASTQPVTAGLNTISTTGNQTAATNVRLASSFQNVGLSMAGIQGAIGTLQQVKSVVMDLIGEANKLQATNLGLENVAKFKGIPDSVIKQEVQNLDLVKNGILTYGEAAQGVSNLMRSGLNLQQSINLLKGFTDSAVFGRQASLELGYAVVSGTEGWRNNNNMLLDNMGMTTNIAVLNKRAGLSEEELANKTTDSTIATKQYNVVMDELAISQGNAEKYVNTFAGTQSKINTEFTIAKQKAGEYVEQGLTPILKVGTEVIEKNMKLVDAYMKLESMYGKVTKGAAGFAFELINLPFDAITYGLLQIADAYDTISNSMRNATGASFVGTGIDGPTDAELLGARHKYPIGKGGQIKGRDIAGNSTLSTKTNRSNSSSSKTEIDTDYSRLQKEISDTQKEFDLLKTELNSSGVSWNNNTYIIKKYIDALDELNKKLADMKFDMTPVNERIAKGSAGLEVGTLPQAPGIELMRGDGSTPMSRFVRSTKTKEEAENSNQEMKQFLKDTNAAGSAISSLTSAVGLADTGFGRAVDSINGFVNGISSFLNFINSLGGGGGGILGTLLGVGASFIPGGSVVAGIAGGGGGILGGSIRNSYQGNMNHLISSRAQGRSFGSDKIIGAEIDGDKFRVMLKDVSDKRGKLIPARRNN